MILSNVELISAIKQGTLRIEGIAGTDPTRPPFNTTSVDLRLGPNVSVPKKQAVALDLRNGSIASFFASNSERYVATEHQPYQLRPGQFILAQTTERVAFPIGSDGNCLSARVEGKSSLARCGLLIHFTAPTIHAGFEGPITLEIINLGPNAVALAPGMYICQLIVERVLGIPLDAPNQFKGQTTPEGTKS